MPEKDVNSPVNSRNTSSKLSGNIPCSSPGARSMPGSDRRDSVPAQPSHGAGSHVSRMSEEPTPLEPRTKLVGE
jgi:hypothetical protein